MTTRALVTGAGGFAGQKLTELLGAEGMEVVGVGRSSPPPDWAYGWASADVRDPASIASVLEHAAPHYVFHLAAASEGTLAELLAVNVLGTQNVLAAVTAAAPAARVVVAGSAAEYGLPTTLPLREDSPARPLTHYGVSKAAQSLVALREALAVGIHVVVARTFNVTGPGEPDRLACGAFARQIAEAELGLRPPTIEVGNLDSERDFLDVRDVVAAYRALADSGEPRTSYNVCSGQPVRLGRVLEILLGLALVKVEVQHRTGAGSRSDVPSQYGDPSRLHNTTGWAPAIPLERSLADLLDSWRDRLGKG